MPARPPKPASPNSLSALEDRLGYTFANPALLRLALTHRSHTYEAANGPGNAPVHINDASQRNAPGTDNEQLEFLGDAVLGLLVTEALLREFPGCTEGELTRMRAALVSRTRMAELGRALSLGDYILLGRGVAQNLAERAQAGVPERPALLANAAEALLAAIFLDVRQAVHQEGTRSIPTSPDPLVVLRALVEKHLLAPDLPALRAALAASPSRGALRDSKTLLQELVQAQSAGKLRYLDTEQVGPPHDRRFTVEVQLQPADSEPRRLATGEGRSKKEAQQAAAALALLHWPEPAPTDPNGTVLADAELAPELTTDVPA